MKIFSTRDKNIFQTSKNIQELYTRRPLFPGSSEIDQIYKICSVLGTPASQDWPQGHTLAANMSFKFPTFTPVHLSQVCPH